jgi:hypothetical protein
MCAVVNNDEVACDKFAGRIFAYLFNYSGHVGIRWIDIKRTNLLKLNSAYMISLLILIRLIQIRIYVKCYDNYANSPHFKVGYINLKEIFIILRFALYPE